MIYKLLCLLMILSFSSVRATELSLAVKNNDFQAVVKLLESGVDVNEKNAQGYTSLMLASGLGNYQMCELLITAGADVFILDNRMGASALHKAAQSGVVPVAKLIIKNGAFVDLQSPSNGNTSLIDASWHRKPEMVSYLLSAGANYKIKAGNIDSINRSRKCRG